MSEQKSGWTRHGHRIKGMVQIGKPKSVARCGGPGLCGKCSKEATAAIDATAPTPDANDPSAQEGLAGVVREHYDATPELIADAILRAGFGPVRAIEAERDAWVRTASATRKWAIAEIDKADARAESATAALAALVAGIEGLADEWDWDGETHHVGAFPASIVHDLRALLPTATNDTKEQQR